VEGGSANDYDYCSGDPVNCSDLGGTWQGNHSVNEWLDGGSYGYVPIRTGSHEHGWGLNHIAASHREYADSDRLEYVLQHGEMTFSGEGDRFYIQTIERRCRAKDRCTAANTVWRWRERVVVDFAPDKHTDGQMVGVINAYRNDDPTWHRGLGPGAR
jgi:hypothetical protein